MGAVTHGLALIKSSQFDQISVVSLALILGGGISNLWDRLTNDGWVIDFMNLGIGMIRTGIFNFADLFIMLGVGILLVYRIRSMVRRKQIHP